LLHPKSRRILCLNKRVIYTPGRSYSTQKQRQAESLKFVAEKIEKEEAKKIIVMSGAGISISAGISDFRTPGSALYQQMLKYDLPYPEAIFDLTYFKYNPDPFFSLAKALYPGPFVPTPVHHFIRQLSVNKVLLRNYTQNIDGLERAAGIPEEKLIEAHGTLLSASCMVCKAKYKHTDIKEEVMAGKVPYCKSCGNIVKPDVIFFGETPPPRFQKSSEDFHACDLLIVIGTSLQVQPFAGLIHAVRANITRLFINKMEPRVPNSEENFLRFDTPGTRDLRYIGDCNAAVTELAQYLKWEPPGKV